MNEGAVQCFWGRTRVILLIVVKMMDELGMRQTGGEDDGVFLETKGFFCNERRKF